MAITSINIIQNNITEDCNVLAIHNPVMFIAEVEYSETVPDTLAVEVKSGDYILNTFSCIPYADIGEKRQFAFIANEILKGYLPDFSDYKSKEKTVEKVVNITRELSLRFYSGDIEASLSFVALHAARQFGENPFIDDINSELLYHAGENMPVYVYFYNDDEDGVITIGQMTVVEVSALDYDDVEFADADDELFTILVEDEVIELTITSIPSISNINVYTGTDVSQLGLPSSITVDLSTDNQRSLAITWDTSGYDKETPGTYQLTGQFQLIDNIKNPLNLIATVNVIVSKLTTIYAALTGGTTKIAKSTDLGDTWQAQAVTLNGNPTCFAKDNLGNLYVGTDTGWIYKLDNGIKTTIIGNFLDNPIKITCLALRKINNINYLTFSFTDTINPVNSMICIYDLNNNNHVLIRSGYDSLSIINNGNSQLILTTSGLISITDISTWQVVSSINNFTTACYAGNGFWYLGTSNGHIWRNTTANDYSAWTDFGLIDNGLNGKSIDTITLINNNRIFITTQDGSFYTDDYFVNKNYVPGTGGNNMAAAWVKDNILIVGNNSGDLIKSTENGLIFNEISETPIFNATSINALIKL